MSMKKHAFFLVAAAICLAVGVSNARAAATFSVPFTLNGGQTETITMTYYGSSDTETTSVSGNFSTLLTWSGNQITGISFVPQAGPGHLSFGNATFSLAYGLVTVSTDQMKGDLNMSNGVTTLSVVGNSFSTLNSQVDLCGGTISAGGLGKSETVNLATDPTNAEMLDRQATITATLAPGSTNLYNLTLVLPVHFTAQNLGDAGLDAEGSGTWTATGQMVVPEPGTVALLLSLAVSAAGYRCWRRRG